MIHGGIVLNGGTVTAGDKLTITTTSDAVRFNGAVTLSTDVRIDTSVGAASGLEVGNVLFTNDASIDSFASEANDLVINAGLASVYFNEDLGTAVGGELGRLEVERADGGVVFGQADNESGLDTGPVNQIKLVGDGTSGNALDLGSLDVIHGGIVLNGGTVTAGDKLTITTTSDAVRFNGAVTLSTDVRSTRTRGHGRSDDEPDRGQHPVHERRFDRQPGQ